MDAAENLRKELTIEFVKTYDPEQAQEIMSHMDNIMWKYEITEREHALVPEGTAIKSICEEYFACMMVDGVKESSAKNYFYIVREFLNTVARPIAEITTNDIRSWICMIQGKNKQTTLANKEHTVFRFFEWAVREEYISKNPMAKIKIAKAKTDERKPLSKKEVIRLKNACADTREKTLLQFLLSTGCRISEATKLKVERNLMFCGVEAPCMRCKERELKCHSNCEKYNTFRTKYEKEREERIREYEVTQYGLKEKMRNIQSLERKKPK